MVDVTDAVLEIDDYLAIEKNKLASDLEWANLLTEQLFEPRNSVRLRKAYVEWKLGNTRNAGQYLVQCLDNYLMEVASDEYVKYETGAPNEFDERPRKRP